MIAAMRLLQDATSKLRQAQALVRPEHRAALVEARKEVLAVIEAEKQEPPPDAPAWARALKAAL
jgi:hypothetical protein